MENDIKPRCLKTGPKRWFFFLGNQLQPAMQLFTLTMVQENFRKHLGLFLDSKLNLFDPKFLFLKN